MLTRLLVDVCAKEAEDEVEEEDGRDGVLEPLNASLDLLADEVEPERVLHRHEKAVEKNEDASQEVEAYPVDAVVAQREALSAARLHFEGVGGEVVFLTT